MRRKYLKFATCWLEVHNSAGGTNFIHILSGNQREREGLGIRWQPRLEILGNTGPHHLGLLRSLYDGIGSMGKRRQI